MNTPSTQAPDIAVLASFSGEGGVERMLLTLVNAFAAQGYRVDLLPIKSASRHLDEIHPEVRRIELGTNHTGTSLVPLTRYLRRYRPPRMLVAKDRAGRLAVRARRLAGVDTRLILRLGTNLSEALKGRNPLQRWLRLAPIRRTYRHLDHIIAVSAGVAADTQTISGVPRERISVVRNPVITPRLRQLAAQAPPHPWLQRKAGPVILGAGRLTAQKDFATLIRAFQLLRDTTDARLIILGEGDRRAELEGLISALGLAEYIDLPGFTTNPYAYMARTDLFVLSSRWEGSPNVLTEAMALDRPVVATDCPSGPNEILDNGRVAPLVSVGDHHALAAAMARVLRDPPPAGRLRAAAAPYEVGQSTAGYLAIIDPPH